MPAARMFLLLGLITLTTACSDPAERAAAYAEKAQALFAEGDSVTALLEAKNALSIEPKNIAARYVLAQAAKSDGAYTEMYEHLKIIVEVDPMFYKAQVDLGELEVIYGNIEAAEHAAQAAAEAAPEYARRHVLNGRIANAKGDIDKALVEWETALEKDPATADAVMLKGFIIGHTNPDEVLRQIDETAPLATPYERRLMRTMAASILQVQNRIPELEKAYDEMLEEFPDETSVQDLVAGYYASQGRLDQAERVRRLAVDRDPGNEEARLLLAKFLYEQRSPETASQVLKQYVTELPDSLRLRLALGQVLAFQGKTDEALREYRRLAEASPMSLEGLRARVAIGVIELNEGKSEAGRATITRVLEDAPNYPEALIQRANWLLVDGKYDEAIADARAAVRREPRNRIANLLLARAYRLSGDALLAKEAYRALLDIDPTNAEASTELAQIEAEEGNVSAAEDLLRERLEISPEDIRAKSMMVDMLLTKSDFAGAEAYARQISGNSDPTGLGSFHLARSYEIQQRYSEAIEAYKQALELNPDSVPAMSGLVRAYLNLQRPSDAIAVVEAASARDPDNPSVRLAVASTYGAVGRTVDAERFFEALVEDFPDSPQAWASWATLYPTSARAKSIAVLDRAISAMPRNQDMVILKGLLLEQNQNFEAAIATYEAALARDESMDQVANNLSALLLDHRDDSDSHARALELAERFLRASKWAYLDTLGWAYYRQGLIGQATRYLERAAVLAEEETAKAQRLYGEEFAANAGRAAAVVHYHLGLAYLENGDIVNAKKELAKALSNPENNFVGVEKARETLASLSEAA